MRNKLLFLSLLIFISYTSSAQSIKFEKTLEIAKEKASSQNKVLFIKVDFPASQNQKIYSKDITIPEVVKIFNSDFINYNSSIDDLEMRTLLNKYKVNKFPALLFFDAKGGFLYSDFGTSTSSKKYLDLISKVKELSKEKSLVDYDDEFKAGKFDREFLKKYIERRISAGFTNNWELADKYVDFLKVSELNDYDEVLFILNTGPLAYGKAYKLASLNQKLLDSVYKTEPAKIREVFNNRIINNTMAFAVSSKSISWANNASSFTRTSWGRNYLEAQKASSLKMIQYYQGVKDTSNYLRQATYFYDQYYMRLPKDSIEKRNAKGQELSKKQAEDIGKRNSYGNTSFMVRNSNFSDVSTQLNNAAFEFYLTGTKNPEYLNKAIEWSKRSIDLKPIYGYYDTLAHLLYRLNYFAEAEFNQQKAIELAKTSNIDLKNLQQELLKMKNKSL
jgi:thioredoxin-related protein